MQVRWIFLALCFLFLIHETASAILIETGTKQRVGGFLEREDAKQITVRIKTPDGKDKVEVYDIARIKVIHKVDRDRLGKLSKDKPKAYRDYANELADKTSDPEAMELAMRLNLIAAYLDPANLGKGCMLSMVALTPRPADARKFRAMAFLLDPKNDPALLKVEAAKFAPPSKTSLKALTEFQKAMKYYRDGDIKRAASVASDKGVAEYFGKAGLTDQKSFLQACSDTKCAKCKAGKMTCPNCKGKKVVSDAGDMGVPQPCTVCNGLGTQMCSSCDGKGQSPPSEDYLRSVLRAEIWALEHIVPSEPTPKKGAAGGWSSAVSNPQSSIPLLTLENITEFDPRKCVYRKGTWELP